LSPCEATTVVCLTIIIESNLLINYIE